MMIPKQTAANFPWGNNENPKTNPWKPLYVKTCNAFIFPLFCPLLVWFGVKLKDLVGGGTVIRAEEAAGSRGNKHPKGPHKQQTGPACGLASLLSHVPTQQRTFPRACKAAGKENPPAEVGAEGMSYLILSTATALSVRMSEVCLLF